MKKKTKSKKKMNIKWMALAIAVIAVLFFILIAVGAFRIRKVDVSGNSYYTEEEIKALVIGDKKNTLSLKLVYDHLGGKEIPFIDHVEISMLSPNHIKIRVYEKMMIGYVEYMGSNLYFDKDGTVVESSGEILDGIPCIKGLEFDTLTLYHPLNVPNEEVFELLLSMNQMMKKYDLDPDVITLKNEGTEIVLTFAKVRINLGTKEHMDEKAAQIKNLLPDLADKSGVLHMEEYTNESTIISFMQDK